MDKILKNNVPIKFIWIKCILKRIILMDIFPKFVIEDDALILQKCTFHHQIVKNRENCIGGGWFKFDRDERSFTLYGRSDDFGQASFLNISKCVENKQVYLKHRNISNDYKFYYQFDDGIKIALN